MKLADVHPEEKMLSLKSLFKAEDGQLIAIKIKSEEELKEHITQNTAFLICLTGEVLYSESTGLTQILKTGEYLEIPRLVPHKLNAIQDSELLLFK